MRGRERGREGERREGVTKSNLKCLMKMVTHHAREPEEHLKVVDFDVVWIIKQSPEVCVELQSPLLHERGVLVVHRELERTTGKGGQLAPLEK